MPTPTPKGQYRKVRYDDDGVTIYQCLWCLGTIRIADDPQYGWNFCPKCGKSWFTRLQCRDHEIPRWVYDRYGNNPPHDLQWYSKRPKATAIWVIESRTKWKDQDWGAWGIEFDSEHEPLRKNFRWAKSMLEQHRLRHDPDDDWMIHEYRARLVRKSSLTFDLDDVGLSEEDKNIVRNLYHKYQRRP